jgi:uncharacterized protein YkwD
VCSLAKLKLWFLLALSIVSLATSLTVVPALAAPADAPAAEMAQVINLVNAERASAGLGPLTYNPTLTDDAQAYSDYMASANFFAHTAPDGSTLTQRAEAAGYNTWTFLAENLAGGQPTPERVVAAWMKSPGHRANILASEATEVGVGHAYNSGAKFGHYWALEFGTRW